MALLAALALAVPGNAAMNPIPSDPVATSGGAVAGTQLASGVRAYLGIPFAAPPVRELRWQAPRPFQWTGLFNADRKGAECIQVLRPHNINHYFGEEPSSEDCLFLNLWTPATANPTSKLPVIVFIYGGGYTLGSSGMANYDGENVAKRGAVYVNFNYRVGAFGYMAHPELSAEQGGHSGNYGLMDQIAALRWVHDNISRFGGDPDRVVIMGQSAGAGSVASLIFAPQAKGTFRGAVMSSGCNFAPAGMMGEGPTLKDAEQVGAQLQKRLGAASLAAMRDLPADRILAGQAETQVGASVAGIRIGGPITDGYILPQTKSEALRAGNLARVPFIASYNSDDIDIGMSPLGRVQTLADYRRVAGEMYGTEAPRFLALFPAKSDAEVRAVARRAATMAGLEGSARTCAKLGAPLGMPGYIDEFTRKHPYVPGVAIADQDIATVGAYHTADIPYWLDTLDKYNLFRPTRNWTAFDRSLSDQMLGALIAFAATGNPGTAARPWPAWSPSAERRMVWGDQVRLEPLDTMRLDWLAAHPAAVVARPPEAPRVRD